MIKTLSLTFGICLLTLCANAKDEGKGKGKGGRGGQPSPEMKELMKKYDKNSDGKLDEGERASISQEDKEKLSKLRDGKGGKKEGAK